MTEQLAEAIASAMTKKRGGKRAGAGKPAIPGLQTYHITCTPTEIATIREMIKKWHYPNLLKKTQSTEIL